MCILNKILCKLGFHNWQYRYYQDGCDPLGRCGHITIEDVRRKCKWCSKKQRMKQRWEYGYGQYDGKIRFKKDYFGK